MLEWQLYQCACPCLTQFEREVMSEKKYSESIRESSRTEHISRYKGQRDGRERTYGRNSAEDPAISSSKSDKPSTNSRPHPRAELKPGSASDGLPSLSRPKHVSNHVSNHTPTKPGTKRKRDSEDDYEDVVWTEHLSSSGRIYYFNEKLKKSQWEKPKGYIKKLKQDTSAPSSSQKAKNSYGTSNSKFSTPSGSATKPLSIGSSDSTLKRLHPVSGTKVKDSSHRTGGSSSLSVRIPGDHRERERGNSNRRHLPSGSTKHSSRSRSGSKSPRGRCSSRDKTPGRSSRAKEAHPTSSSGRPAHGSQTSPITPLSTKTPSSGHIPSSVAVVSPPLGTSQQYLAEQNQRTPTLSPRARQKLNFSRQQQVVTPTNGPGQSSSYGQDLVGGSTPVTPVQGYQLPGTDLISPQYAQVAGCYGDSLGGLHPLQQALLLKQQGYIPQDPGILPDTPMDTTPLRVTVSAIPSHLSTSSPLPVSPIAISPLYTPAQSIQGTPVASYYVSQPTTPLVLQPITPVQVHPQHVFGTPLLPTGGPQGISYVQTQESPLGGPSASAGFLPLRTSTLLRTPMARLGYSDPDGTRYSQFPDIGVLEPVSQTPVNQEFFRRELVDTWWTNDQIQKQVDSCSHEYLLRRCTDSIALSGKLAWRKLALERSRVKSTSRTERIESIRKLAKNLDRRYR